MTMSVRLLLKHFNFTHGVPILRLLQYNWGGTITSGKIACDDFLSPLCGNLQHCVHEHPFSNIIQAF